MKSKRIAIIGANGMLGSDLVAYLSKHFSVTAITKENYTSFVNKDFDIVINANGNSKRFWANEHILEDFTLSTVSVYKSLFDFEYKVYIYISSSDVYPDHTNKKSTKEDQPIFSSALSPYGFHKYLSELIVQTNVKKYLILRCSMMLGTKLKKGPLYDIFHKKPLFIAKESQLQMITTKEISNCIYFLLKKGITNNIFNIGGSGVVSFSHIEQIMSQPVRFVSHAEKQEYEMNVSKLKSLYLIKTSKEYLQEFLDNYQS